jgi:hypothetical protein
MTEKEARGAGSAGGERRPDKLKTRELLPEGARLASVPEAAYAPDESRQARLDLDFR